MLNLISYSFQHFPKHYPLLFYSHIITYYSHIFSSLNYSIVLKSNLIIIIILLFFINVSGSYILTSRETRTLYVLVLLQIQCKFYSDTSKWSMKVILAFLKLIHLSCHCQPLILISNSYQLFLNYACECPMILKL